LLSKKDKVHRSKRPVDVEPVFGILKQNKSFRRFSQRGIEKVNIEFGLLAIVHNLKKLSKKLVSYSFLNAFENILGLLHQIITRKNHFSSIRYY
jgi:hypothetical protein